MATVVAEPGAAKAATLTSTGEMRFFSFPIEKVEDAGDGTIEVIGKATDGTLDSDLQIVDPDWSEKALKEWFDTGGNVRVQHNAQRDPAGKGIQVDGHSVRARVVEPVAVKLVQAGVLQDFSVGIMNPDIRVRDPQFKHLDPAGKAVNGVITGRPDGMSKIGEVSLVDRGSNFGTRFAMVKAAASDGAPEWVGELTAPDDVLAKVAKPAKPKTVSVELPADVRVTFSPKDLAKLTTFRQRLEEQGKATAPAVTKDADASDASLDAEPEGGEDGDDDDVVKAAKAAESAVYKRDIDTATRRRLASEGKALPNLSYPVETHEDADNAVTLILSGHGDTSAAKRMVSRIARKEGWTDILDRLKGGKKKAKTTKVAAKAASAECDVCKGKGMADGKPCGCPKGKKIKAKIKIKAKAAKAATAATVEKKTKVMCGGCGARQNSKHQHCSECGRPMAGAMPVEKNHVFTCLGCGKELDKGEPHCPQCGKKNPGYLPEADHQIPANQDKAAKAGKRSVAKRKKGGKRPTPGSAGGVPGNKEKPAARHREPDGAEVEAFEQDASMTDGDNEGPTPLEARTLKHADPAMAASLMLSTLGVPENLGGLHALSCPAYKAADVAAAFPHASFAGIDLAEWQAGALTKAASAPLDQAEKALDIWRAAATLKACDPHLLADLRDESHKMFTDANPGPGTFPTPSELGPARFNRPYLTAGHAAPSPDQEGPNSAKLPPVGGIMSEDYTRGYLSEGHAADAPENTHPSGPMPPPDRTGVPTSGPARQYYTNAARDGARHALQIMHDHIAFSHPDICPMHGGDDIARHPVPTPQGVPAVAPAPGKKGKNKAAAKAAKAKARKAAARRRARERRLTAQVMKGKITVDDARVKLGRKPVTPAAPVTVEKAATDAPEAPPAVDPKAITKAVKAATKAAVKPLHAQIAGQDRALRRLRKQTAQIAAQPDTTNAPFRGSALTKQASPVPAGPVTVADSVEHAKAARIRVLEAQWRNDPDPALREAAYSGLMQELGINNAPPTTMRT